MENKLEWYQQKVIDLIEKELYEYVGENCYSSDADGDWVEFEESDDYCITLNNILEAVKNEEV